jgi:hypothetical protein
MVRPGRAGLAGIQERGQVLRVELWQVPGRGSALSTQALEHDMVPSQIGVLAVGEQATA